MNKINDKQLKITSIVFASIAVALLVVAFFCPPLAFVDSSVIAAVGEIMGIIAIFMGWEAIDRGIDATIKHRDTEITFNNPDKEDKE